MKRFTFLIRHCMLLCLCVIFLQQANAQGCGCDFTLGPNSNWKFDGDVEGVQPGDTICLASGTRPAGIVFVHLRGTRQQPIVITNVCNGKTIINSGGWADVFTIDTSYHVRVTGSRPTGNPADPYGIEVRNGSMAMRIQGLSTDVEVDHVRINGAGCCGIVAHTDPTCDPRTWRPNFIMKNIKLHDNYLSNLGCEGFYIGNSHYDSGRELTCNGSSVIIQEHAMDSTEVYNNILDHIGQDGIQVGGGFHTKIYNNTIKHWAEQGIEFHSHGIQAGSGTTEALVYNNKLDSGGYCFTDQGGGGIWFNNVAKDCKRGGIYMSDPAGTYAPTGFTFVNNTLVNYGGYGIQVYDFSSTVRSTIKNNILAGSTTQQGYIQLYNGTGARTDTAKNLRTTNIAGVGFVNAAAGDYHLLYNSPAVDKGVNTSANGVTTDIDGITRPQWSAYDIGAYEYNGTTPPPGDTTTPPPATVTATSKFNFTWTSQFVNGGWISVNGDPHASVLTGIDAATGWRISSIATAQWPPAIQNGVANSSDNGGTTIGSVQPPEVMVTNWFNYNAPYGATVNGVVQGDNLAVTGLIPNSTYTLQIGGSRRTNNGATAEELGTMEYRFNGVNPQPLLVTSNATRQVTVTATSDANGRIGISALPPHNFL